MTKTRNWHTKAIYLIIALVMTLGLLIVPAAGVVVAQTEVCGSLGTCGGDTAEWVAGQTHVGAYTPLLTKDGTGSAGSTHVQFTLDTGITIAEFQADITAGTPEWSFWHNLQALSANWVQFELRFEDPSSVGWVEITAVGLQGTLGTAAWLEETLSGTTPAGYGGVGEGGGSFFNWGPLTPLSGIEAAIDGEGAVTDASDWELERVRLELWEIDARYCYVDEVTIAGTTYDLEPCYSIFPPIAKDVKGSKQEFYILDGGSGERANEDLSFNWTVTEKLNLYPGDVEIIAGGDGYNYIVIRALEPGDASVECIVAGAEAVPAEKKWGIIDHTILDLDPETPETPADPDGDVTAAAGTVAAPETEEFSDWIYARFYQEPFPATFVDEAGHAVVHWWLITDDAAGANEAAIDAIMADLGPCPEEGTEPCGCGSYADWPDGVTPFSAINDVWAADPADHTTFTDVVQGITVADADPSYENYELIDGDFNVLGSTYIMTMTENDMVGQTRGLVQVEVSNTGAEDILIVTLTEYPWDYFGENPVCIEKGTKDWPELPPPPEECQVKVPQVRWAGEKIVLEKYWGENYVDNIVEFYLEEGCVGNMIPLPVHVDSTYLISGDARTALTVVDSDGVARAMLESEQQGEVDVKCVLYDADLLVGASYTATARLLQGEDIDVIGNHGFLVYYLALEDVTVDEELSDLEANAADADADVLVKVRGWFTSDALPGTDRAPVDTNGDHVYELPAGRYVLPDDWAALAGSDEATSNLASRPQYDLMNTPGDGVESDDELGPYDTDVRTTDPPGEAEEPSIGPFNTLQPWNCVDELGDPTNMWIATASVPADYTVAALTTVWDTDDLRNTVVPDTTIDEFDCPMPQALVTFDVDDTEVLNELDKEDASGYGVDAGGDFIAPFYRMEIPSHWLIPVGGYRWDSWGMWTTPITDDGPYNFWDDLGITPHDADILEVYSDNHGYAGVTIDGDNLENECVTLDVIADFPVMAAKYPAVETDTEVCWGISEKHLNPDFEADPRSGTAPLEVTFDPYLTAGGTPPYVKAEWDFNGDGVIEVTRTGSWNTPGDIPVEIWTFNFPGVYTIALRITDSTPAPAGPLVHTETKFGYVTVTGSSHPYDANHNGIIDKDEALQAIIDYFDTSITKEEVLGVITLYFESAG